MSDRVENVVFFRSFILAACLAGAVALGSSEAAADGEQESDYLGPVETFADNVLEHGRDTYGEEHTPLFVDGLNVETLEPVVWRYKDDEWIVSNFASQQNLLRTLGALSELTGEPRYREAAEAATAYMLEHHRDKGGLLYWGGHQFVDLKTQQNIGHFDADCHELKTNLPFYIFLHEVDPGATASFLRAFWDAHVVDWEVLDMNRHGRYGRDRGTPWDHEFSQPEPFFEGRGLTFINTGTDLIHAGGMLYRLNEEEGALKWAHRLAEQYVRARHPETGLGAYQYSKPERRQDPPEEGPLTGRLTWSSYGDRAEKQFGAVYGDVAREGWALWGGRKKTIYVQNALVQLELAKRLGERGEDLLEWTIDGIKAHTRHAYDPEHNHFRPMWADGTDLTGQTYPRTGYYGERGTEFKPTPAGPGFLFAYSRAHRLSEAPMLWKTLRSIMQGLELGDPGSTPDEDPELNLETGRSEPETIFALLELARATEDPEPYLALAERVGENLLERRFHEGFFLPTPEHVNARFDAVGPLALLALEAARRGEPDAVPTYSGGDGYIHGTYGDRGRTTDGSVIWSERR